MPAILTGDFPIAIALIAFRTRAGPRVGGEPYDPPSMRPVRGVAIASIVARCVQAGTLLALSRLVPLDQFGDAGVLMAIAAALQPAATLRMDGAMLVPSDRDEAARLGSAALMLAGLASVVFALLLLAVEPTLAAWLHLQAGLPAWLIAPGLLLATSVGAVGTTAMSRAGQFQRLAVARVASALLTTVASILLALGGFGVAAILVCFALGSALPGMWGIAWLRTDTGGNGPRAALGAAWRHRHFAMLASPGALCNALALRAPAFVLPGHLGTEGFAAVDSAGRVWFTALNPFIDAVQSVFQHRTAGGFRDRHGSQRASVRIVSLRLLAIAIAVAIPIMVAGPTLFGIVFGSAWTVVGTVCAILAPALVVQTVASAMSVILLSSSRLGWLFGWQASYCVVRYAALFLAAPRFGLEQVAQVLLAVDAIAYAACAALAYRAVEDRAIGHSGGTDAAGKAA